jgi:hypothetical protein
MVIANIIGAHQTSLPRLMISFKYFGEQQVWCWLYNFHKKCRGVHRLRIKSSPNSCRQYLMLLTSDESTSTSASSLISRFKTASMASRRRAALDAEGTACYASPSTLSRHSRSLDPNTPSLRINPLFCFCEACFPTPRQRLVAKPTKEDISRSAWGAPGRPPATCDHSSARHDEKGPFLLCVREKTLIAPGEVPKDYTGREGGRISWRPTEARSFKKATRVPGFGPFFQQKDP